MPYHNVKQGDCFLSVASAYGMAWEYIWNHTNNSELRKRRGNPTILLPGDQVFIPDMDSKEVGSVTNQTHRFRKKDTPALLILRLKRNGKIFDSKPYTLIIDGETFEGETDSDGRIDMAIPPDANRGQLLLSTGSESYDLVLGGLDPVDEVSGVQARLHNLGLAPGPIDGIPGPLTKAAVQKFQQQVGAKVDGIVGPETRKYLEDEYGC